MSTAGVTARYKHYHGGAKGKVTAKTVQPAPAWRPRNIPADATGSDPGSKILISNLPNDVSELEVVDLMRKTIGPVNVRDSCLIHNSKGVPRGMAIVAFTRGIDASRARARYNGKIIDGKRTIKLEIILDRDFDPTSSTQTIPKQQRPRSLFDRIGSRQPSSLPVHTQFSNGPTSKSRRVGAKPHSLMDRTSLPERPPAPTPTAMRKRMKKGPKRVKKSIADLDREIEEYSAARALENGANGNGIL